MYKKMSSSLLYLSLTTQFYSVLSNMLPVYMNKTQHNNNAMKKIIFLFCSHFRYSTFMVIAFKLDRSIIRLLLLFIHAFLQLFDNTDNSGGDQNDEQDPKHGCWGKNNGWRYAVLDWSSNSKSKSPEKKCSFLKTFWRIRKNGGNYQAWNFVFLKNPSSGDPKVTLIRLTR